MDWILDPIPHFMAKLPKKGTGIEINYDELIN